MSDEAAARERLALERAKGPKTNRDWSFWIAEDNGRRPSDSIALRRAVQEGIEFGVAEERAAIVAYLRGALPDGTIFPKTKVIVLQMASAIERGEHADTIKENETREQG